MAAGPGACDHSETMIITIQLLGRPRITWGSAAGYKFRSRKSWGLLAYLILSDRPRTRSQLASLLFAEADDPLRALRWSLAEIRRALGDDGSSRATQWCSGSRRERWWTSTWSTKGTWTDCRRPARAGRGPARRA